jgi:CBS domain-containing membrane protein
VLSNTFLPWLRGFLPAPVALKWPERLKASVGALLGIAFTGGITALLLGANASVPFLVAPMGASAVLLFGVPASPLAQPWSVMGGNLLSATIGVACATLIPDQVDAGALAVALSIAAMFLCRCVHPPSGAVALTAVLGGPAIHALGFGFVLAPIALQSLALVVAAIAFHALTGHRYPHAARVTQADASAVDQGFTRGDLEAVLARRGELLDIDAADLESLLRETQLRAYARTFDEMSCADIMSRGVISVSSDTTAELALHLLTRHRVKALPVTDTTRRVVGILTRADLAVQPDARWGALTGKIERLFRGPPAAEPLVGTLMTVDVCTVAASKPIAELVPVFADFGHHHIPVVDAHGRLVGMITETDLITGLYRQSQPLQRTA